MTDPGSSSADLTAEPPAENRLFVLILQHPQERREPLSTAAATVAGLRRAKLAVGLSWPNLTKALGRNADPRQWGVLYLGSAQPKALGMTEEIAVLGRDGTIQDGTPALLPGLEGIILLDGTWSQAKTLWWRNPWLLKPHRVVLNPVRPARLGRLRREPRREALSTIEAAALLLRHVERQPAAADSLLQALDRLMRHARQTQQEQALPDEVS